jgi:hypothetical protein
VRENEINIVTRTEHHALATCPCGYCVVERERRAGTGQTPANEHIKHISVDTAFAVGLISHRSPFGSVARGLACQKAPQTIA